MHSNGLKLTGVLVAFLAAGAASQANAGFIDMDFTDDDKTIIIDADVADADAPGPGNDSTSNHKTVSAPSLEAAFGIDLSPFGFAGSQLRVTGKRSAVPVFDNRSGTGPNEYVPAAIRLSRWENNGLAICSRYDNIGSSQGCREENHTIDGADDGPDGLNDLDESIRFSIDPELKFAVRYVTFGYTDNNDNVRMRFQTGLGNYIDFSLGTNSDTDYRNCSSGVCTVDIYELADTLAGLSDSAYVAFNTDPIWNAGHDAIYNYLASSDGFEFFALADTDDWKIRGAVWVTSDPIVPAVPEPASLSLIGAGLMGLAYMGKRRRAANR